MMTRPVALRFILSGVFVTSLVVLIRESLASALLSSLETAIDWIDLHHYVTALSIERVGGDTVLRMEAGIRRAVVMSGHVTAADPRARAVITTPVLAFLIGPTCALIVALAVPAKGWTEMSARLALTVVLCLPLLAVDAPFVLDAHLWELHRDAHSPDAILPILVWRDFLKNGGRLVSGMATGLLCVRSVKMWLYRKAPTEQFRRQPSLDISER